MESVDINVLAVAVAAIFAFGLGSLWYSPVMFGKAWARLIGRGDDMGSIGARHIITLIIIALVSATALAAFVSWSSAANAGEGAIVGIIVALAFQATYAVNMVLFERRPLELFFINNGYGVVSFAVQGGILASWS